jgi:transporter family-2 protein
MENVLVPLSLLAGGLLPIQAGANAQLSKAVASPMAATTLQLSIGALLLLSIAAAAGSLGALANVGDVPWWHLLGGLASALYIAAGILLFPRLGAVVTVGLFVAGQMLASITLDSFGLLGVAPQPFDIATALGAAAALLGTMAIVKGQPSAANVPAPQGRTAWMLLALTAGAVLPVQGAVNAMLRSDLAAPLAVGAVSFVVATLGMASVFLLAIVTTGAARPQAHALPGMPWWGWLGGFVGATYVVTVFLAIPQIGAAATIGLTIGGQQLVSLLVDRHGLLRLPRRPISPLRLVGVALLLVGVAIILAL